MNSAAKNARIKRWRDAHKEEIAAKSKAKYAASPEVRRAQARAWSRENRDRENARKRALYRKDPERVAAYHRRSMLKLRYGITDDVFKKLVADQNGLCAVCCQPMSGRPCIDHDHHTGSIRELLCHKCNRGLGHFNDDPSLLRRAIAYLEKHARPKQVG
jgi:hypothetical protein